MTRTSLSGLALFAFVAIGCGGGGKEPAAPDPTASAPKAAGDETVSTTTGPASSAVVSDVGGEAAAPARKRKPFEIHSSCSDVVTLVFAEDPKTAGASRRTIAPSSTLDGPRDEKGNQTVWLLDEKGEPLVKVHVTRGMKHLEVGRSCRTLDAH